ncbi:MAG: hypothetical protein ACRBM6_05070, partial [Geminicoccales bacterium]
DQSPSRRNRSLRHAGPRRPRLGRQSALATLDGACCKGSPAAAEQLTHPDKTAYRQNRRRRANVDEVATPPSL